MNDQTLTLERQVMQCLSRLAARSRAVCVWATILSLALNLASCGDTAAIPTVAPPSPTIAAPPPPSATPAAAGRAATRPPVTTQPTATPPTFASPTVAPQAGTPAKQEPFVYLWPSYLPEGMQL